MRHSMIDDPLVQRVVSIIVDAIQPRQIVLFGSRAHGAARRDSDWDFLVIADSDLPRYQRAAPLYGMLSDLRQPVDILVYTPAEVKEWSTVDAAFVTTAIREGKVLYENKG